MKNNTASLKMLFLWTPIVLWYGIQFCFPYSPAFFEKVDTIYYHAAHTWIHAQFLYGGIGQSRFVYLPTSAAMLSLISWMPVKAFEIVFRLLSLALLSSGIYYFCTTITKNNANRSFFITLLTTVILSQAAFFQGQMHMIIAGLMLLGYVAIAREQWWQAAIFLTLALALKPTSIVLYLLALALYPKLSLKLLLCSAAIFLLSFLAQSPHYVATQYHDFVQSFKTDMQYDGKDPGHWATLMGAIAFYFHVYIKDTAQFAVRIVVAGFVFFSCLYARLKFNKTDAIYFIFALGMCYLMLFNSRTENNDYVMIAPMIGYSLYLALTEKKYWQVGGLIFAIVLLAASWQLCRAITPHNNVWLSPSVVFVYFVYLLRCEFCTSTSFQKHARSVA
jgi:hypothetical protein